MPPDQIPPASTASRFLEWLPLPIRGLVVWQLAEPAFSKFYAYDQRVQDFIHHGAPAPAVTVILVGIVEIVVTVGVALGIAGRLVAIPQVVIMVWAIALVGPEFGNVSVLLGCLAIALLGTGRLSLWRPEERWVRMRVAARGRRAMRRQTTES